ncbi:MAG TPA: IS701 family transposase [Polyangiaceae bacterium]
MLPQSWTDSPERRQEARIPDELTFKTKPELALEMITRAVADGVPKGVVLGDSAYGSSIDFRTGVRALGLHYAVGVDPKTSMWRIEQQWNRGESLSVRELALQLRYRRCTWRKGTKVDLTAKFALTRVLPAHDGGLPANMREALWLLVEWRDGEKEPANYFLCSLPERTTKKQLIRIVMQRWRTERLYEDLKNELGLDHFEGRRFLGWHHHISVALCCYTFIVAERVQRFPPSARRSVADDAQPLSP